MGFKLNWQIVINCYRSLLNDNNDNILNDYCRYQVEASGRTPTDIGYDMTRNLSVQLPLLQIDKRYWKYLRVPSENVSQMQLSTVSKILLEFNFSDENLS